MRPKKTKIRPHSLFKLSLLVFFFQMSAQALAQTPTTGIYIYRSQSGDKLSSLTGSLWRLPANAEQALQYLVKLNPGVNFHRLKAGQSIQVPQAWLRFQTQNAKASQVECQGIYWPSISTPEEKVLEVGDLVGEGAVLKVPAACQVTLTLPEGSRIHLPSGAAIEIDQLRIPDTGGSPQVRLKLLEGKMALDVLPKRPVDAVLEVKTPRSIAGVRGTQFRVGFDSETQISRVEVIQGEVQNQGEADVSGSRLSQGTGQWVNTLGASAAPTALPKAPEFLELQIRDQAGTGTLVFSTTPHAKAYGWGQGQTVNPFAASDKRSADALKIELSNLSGQAQIWRVSSIDAAGLQGADDIHAVCQPNALTTKDLCSVAFDTSNFLGRPMRLTLTSQKNQPSNSVDMHIKLLAPDNGKLWVGALRAGKYHYRLSHLPAQMDAFNQDHWVSQSGHFQLTHAASGKP
jgi:hypothetical protein